MTQRTSVICVLALTTFLFMEDKSYATTVLTLGDSQLVGRFGSTLHEALARPSKGVPALQVHTYGKCGAAAGSWRGHRRSKCGYFEQHDSKPASRRLRGRMPSAKDLVQKHRPDVIVIQLGGNMAGMSKTRVSRNIKALVKDLDLSTQTKCLWVGTSQGTKPSRKKRHDTIAVILNAIGQNCLYFDSWLKTFYPPGVGDGRHFSRWRYKVKPTDSVPFPIAPGQWITGYQIARQWALHASRWIKSQLP